MSTELFGIRSRLAELKALKQGTTSFNAALRVQKERLSLSSWLKTLAVREDGPTVLVPAINPGEELDMLCSALARIDAGCRAASRIDGDDRPRADPLDRRTAGQDRGIECRARPHQGPARARTATGRAILDS